MKKKKKIKQHKNKKIKIASVCERSKPALKSNLTHSVLPYLVAKISGFCLNVNIFFPNLSIR